MKLSHSPRHFAPRKKKLAMSKNHPGHRSHGGKREGRASNIAAEMISMFFGKMSRRTRRVFLEQERASK